jgi:glycosyltransferase involved in cell wall biosynthesis
LDRNCLVVSYYFPPAGGGGVQRWTKFIKYLSNDNWRFTIITAQPDAILAEDKTLLQEIPEKTRIIRIKNAEPAMRFSQALKTASYWKRWLSAFIYVTDSRVRWNATVLPVICTELDRTRYDTVIITMPPYMLADLAAKLTSCRREPVVLDMRDPWSINPYKIYPTPVHRILDQRRELKTIRRINFLISAYQSIINHYSLRIPEFHEKKSIVIPNGYDEDDLTEKRTAKVSENRAFKIAFSGTFYSHLNHPENFFNALQVLNLESKNIHFYHFGKSVYDLTRLAKRYQQKNFFHAMGYLSHRNCLTHLMAMDAFLLVLDNRVVHADKTIGGKVYEYLALKKPILALVPENGEAAALIRATDSGIVCANSNMKGIISALRDLIAGKRDFRFHDIEQYNRRNQAVRLKIFLEQIIASDNSDAL